MVEDVEGYLKYIMLQIMGENVVFCSILSPLQTLQVNSIFTCNLCSLQSITRRF